MAGELEVCRERHFWGTTMKKLLLSTAAMSLIAAAAVCGGSVLADPDNDHGHGRDHHTATPIKHLVVIFNENRSFDHYFATYPNAANPPGEIPFRADRETPTVNNLATANLLTNNPNLNPANGAGATNPFRLDRTQANTADQNHGYKAEQEAYDNGKADLFPKFTGNGTPGGVGAFGTTGQVMGYFDGNTVMAIWNYAQFFALNDNAYTDTYGPSSPGALEVVSGQTNGGMMVKGTSSSLIPDGQTGFTLIGDIDPADDVCSSATTQVQMTSKNIGDLLNTADISWGGFAGGFNLQAINANGSTGCARSTFSSVVGGNIGDYVPHHIWFQYFASTANPTHARPSSVEAIGHTMEIGSKTPDPANHEYDLQDFFNAVKAGNFPAVSYIKMAAYQDAHPGNSDPLDEQQGVVDLINFLELQPDWRDTAVILTYDDSDGWYDHAFAVPTSASYNATDDQVNGPGLCGKGAAVQPQPDGLAGKPVNGRCGPGTRVPFLVISPYAKRNFVSHTRISQASVVRFIEDNWLDGQRLGGGSFDASAGSIMDLFDFGRGDTTDRLFLDPETGIVISPAPPDHH
jgi:phospholipase C